jgi:hypothetical protein
MADNVVENQDVQQVDPAVELQQQMAIALGGKMPEEQQQQATPTPEEAAAAAQALQTQQQAAVDYFAPIKDKYGYQSHEDAIKEIEELRAFKAAPVVHIPFENEDSERFFNAVTKGDRKTVYEILHKEQQIDRFIGAEITAENAADVVKLAWVQSKYKDLSAAEIDYKFKKTFAVPPKPAQAVGEEVEDYNERLGAWQEIANDKAMELLIEAKLAKPELEAAKSKLVFPEIADSQDEGYVQYKKALELKAQNQAGQAQKDAEAVAAYKAFTPESIETKLPFIDEANKINFEFQYKPDAESFAKAQAMSLDVESFFESFYDKDGNPDRKAFLDAVYFAKNKNAIILQAINQGKNAGIKSMLPDNSQGGGLVRQMTNQAGELSELDKQMQAAGIRRQ